MDQLILHHGMLLVILLIALLVFTVLVVASAIHVHANASEGIPRDPLEGNYFKR